MNWALDPRQPRRSTAAPVEPVAKPTKSRTSKQKEEE